MRYIPNNTTRLRPGFTLLEIMLALLTLVMLMALIFQAISNYTRLSNSGRIEVEQTQIARAVLQQMATDIRCVVFAPVETEEDDEALDEEDDSDTAAPIEPSPDMAAMEEETGLFGTAEDLLLYVNRPDRRMEYVSRDAAVSAADRTSDMLTIRYFLARPGEAGVVGAFADTETPVGAVVDVVGLARQAGDRMAINNASRDGDMQTQVEATSLMAKEVVSLAFRYYDTGQWYDFWDTTSSNRLPQAIEITIGVQVLDEEDPDSAEDAEIREFRRVVAMPLTPPIDPEAY